MLILQPPVLLHHGGVRREVGNCFIHQMVSIYGLNRWGRNGASSVKFSGFQAFQPICR
jgi:hypothetical protein